jgi:hypothetical protein
MSTPFLSLAGALPLVQNLAQAGRGMLGGKKRPVIDEEEARKAVNPLDQPTAVSQQAPVKQQGGIFSNIGNWIGANPELTTGLITSGIGALSGMQPLDYLGLGGQAYAGREAETRRRYEFEREMEARTTPTQINIDQDARMKQMLELYNEKDPARRAEMMRIISAGGTPGYSGGIFGMGKKVVDISQGR